MAPIGKPRRRRPDARRRRGPPRKREKLRTDAEQLDFEMELLKAQREGREDAFREEERARLRARKAEALDAEMDEYFRARDDKPPDDPAKTEAAPPADPDPDAAPAPGPPPAPPAQPAEAASA